MKPNKKIVFVTHNRGKVASAQEYFKNIKLEIYDYELSEPRSSDIKEIAKAKVDEAYKLVKKPCIALDSAFFITALNGFPAAFVNFSLETIGIKGILKLMQDVPDRSCEFRECLAYYDGEDYLFFEGITKGELTTEIKGQDTFKKWSELWYIFKPFGYLETLAEMSDEVRSKRPTDENNINAMAEFAKYIENLKK